MYILQNLIQWLADMYTLQIKALAFKLLFMYMYALSRNQRNPFVRSKIIGNPGKSL